MRADPQQLCLIVDGPLKFPEGSHRMRNELQDTGPDAGKPKQEDWTRSKGCNKANELKELEEMKEFEDIIIADTFTKDHEVVRPGKS